MHLPVLIVLKEKSINTLHITRPHYRKVYRQHCIRTSIGTRYEHKPEVHKLFKILTLFQFFTLSVMQKMWVTNNICRMHSLQHLRNEDTLVVQVKWSLSTLALPDTDIYFYTPFNLCGYSMSSTASTDYESHDVLLMKVGSRTNLHFQKNYHKNGSSVATFLLVLRCTVEGFISYY